MPASTKRLTLTRNRLVHERRITSATGTPSSACFAHYNLLHRKTLLLHTKSPPQILPKTNISTGSEITGPISSPGHSSGELISPLESSSGVSPARLGRAASQVSVTG